MKKILVIAAIAIAFTACKQNAKDKVEEKVNSIGTETAPAVLAADAPKFEFEKEIHDFAVIQEGEKVQASFKFKNTGKTPLIITGATATCGCTVPEYPKTPIKPGEEGTIAVVFDSQGKVGMQDKVVTITSNANPQANKLHLVGEVKAKK
jgi:Na+-translocating ferredoxin:NAD+ oxidoreductase RnfG subunit